MGNLVKETPYSEITATLEVLDRFGITREHLFRLRSDSEYANLVAQAVLSGKPLKCWHCGSLRLKRGLRFLSDVNGYNCDAVDLAGNKYLCRDCEKNKRQKELDITVIKDEKEIPSELRDWLWHESVTSEFISEDDMDDPAVLRMKVNYFRNDYKMDPKFVKFFVLLTRNPQTNWGKGFPYQVKIYAFPKNRLCREQEQNCTTAGRAQIIMGRNMLTLANVEQHFNVRFTNKELSQLASSVPWSEKVLQECMDTHILFPGYPLTIQDIRNKAPKGTFRCEDVLWYNDQNFGRKEKVNLRWYLIRKNAVKDFFDESTLAQIRLLKENEYIPMAVEIVYMTTLYYLVNNIRLFGDHWVRCLDVDFSGNSVVVGYFDHSGLSVGSRAEEFRHFSIGLAASRKPNT